MSNIPEFKNIPDVSFIGNATQEGTEELFLESFLQAYRDATGSDIALGPADVPRLMIKAGALMLYQIMQYIDDTGKQDLLKYSYGEYLDNIALRMHLTRKPAESASVLLRFALSATQANAVGIPAGTRVATESGVYFATDEYAEIAPAGFAATTLAFYSQTEHEGISIPAGTEAEAEDGRRFKTTVPARIEPVKAATVELTFSTPKPLFTGTTVPAGTRVAAEKDGKQVIFVTDANGDIDASEPAVVMLRFYPPAEGTAFIPLGSIYQTGSGLAFVTDEDLEVDAADDYAEVSATAVVPGDAFNAVPAGTAMTYVQQAQTPTGTIHSPTSPTAQTVTRVVTSSTSMGGVTNNSVEISASALYAGADANGCEPGSINRVVDESGATVQAPYTVTNTAASSGGSGTGMVTAPAIAEEAGVDGNGYAPAAEPAAPAAPAADDAKANGIHTLVNEIEGVSYVRNTTETAGGFGRAYVDVTATAEEPGLAGNGYAPGTIRLLVDPVAYIGSVENLTESSGGSDTEDDDSFTRRVYYAPQGYSVAGPLMAYESLALNFRGDIESAKAVSPAPCEMNVYIILTGGRLPTENDLQELQEYLSGDTVRPQAELVVCKAPTEVDYQIALSYWISETDAAQATAIQTAVKNAVAEFVTWQRSLGRDINPTELIRKVREAGAKRVDLTAPAFAVVSATQIPRLEGEAALTYGGLEDD